jgi:HSP20 family protein
MTNGCCTTTATIPNETTLATPRAATLPALDLVETPEEFRLTVDVPGRGPEDVEVGVENRVLTIQARVPARDEPVAKYHVREHGPRELVRRLRLSDAIDANGIRGEVARGVLTVHLPKVPAAQPRRIEVR